MQSRQDHSILLLLAGLFVFATPFTHWWASLPLPWYGIFGPWALLVALAAYNHWRSPPHDD